MKKTIACILTLLFVLSGCAGKASAPQPQPLSGPVSYLGPEGTYTEEATELFFGAGGDHRPQKTVTDAVAQVLNGSCRYAVIPQENTIGGPVYNYVDELLAHPELSIVGEVELPIRQALLAAEGTALSDIRVVYSHQQGIVQGAAWLAENLPNAEVVEVSSTAEGAKMVSEAADGASAAVASVGAAKVYGLQVLAQNIQQNDDNQTRFYVLSTEAAAAAENDRMVFSAAGDAEDLPLLLKAVDKCGVELISIHDRPEKTTLGRYVYLIECANGSRKAYETISGCDAFSYHWFGTFPVR